MKGLEKVRKVFVGTVLAGLVGLTCLLVTALPAEASSKGHSYNDSQNIGTTLKLVNRDSIQLDPGESWYDATGFSYYKLQINGRTVACNSPGGHDNWVKNHFGTYTSGLQPDLTNASLQGHAYAFTFRWETASSGWDAGSGAYAVVTSMPYLDYSDNPCFTNCTWKHWNVAGKKTSNHTKIQTYSGNKKAEEVFWLSYNPSTSQYRIWSALAGRPVGYTTDDLDNLKTLDNHEANTYQYFQCSPITTSDIYDFHNAS